MISQSNHQRSLKACFFFRICGPEPWNSWVFGHWPPEDEEKYANYAKSSYFKDSKLPKDSWGSEFIYINDNGNIELISLGADKKEGGKDEAADIKMSECK